jgi:hypothetical protein
METNGLWINIKSLWMYTKSINIDNNTIEMATVEAWLLVFKKLKWTVNYLIIWYWGINEVVPPLYEKPQYFVVNFRRVAIGGWRLAVGGWRMAVGGWRMADGGWRMADGGWWMAVGGWRLAVGSWRMAVIY